MKTISILLVLLAAIAFPAPVKADTPPPLNQAIQLSSTWGETCALLTTGKVLCWNSEQLTPFEVDGLSDVVQIVSGHSHHCALTANHAMYCWGLNNYGQLGIGIHDYSSPTPVIPIGHSTDVELIAAYDYTTCAVRHGGLKCWGWLHILGESYSPVKYIGEGTGVKSILLNEGSSCALLSSGGIKCWGSGPLGDGTNNNSPTPVNVVGFVNYRAWLPLVTS